MYRDIQIVRQGSRIFPYAVPKIDATKTFWYDIFSIFGNEAILFNYFDALVIINNSALPIHYYHQSVNEDYLILPNSTQPITRRPFSRFGFYNPDGAIDVAAGEVTMNMRRLPPDVTAVVNQS